MITPVKRLDAVEAYCSKAITELRLMTFSQETEIQYYVRYCNDEHIFPQILCATVTIKF